VRKRAVFGLIALGLIGALTGGVIAQASGSDPETSRDVPGEHRAVAAALRIIRGGNVNAVERDGEGGGTWEVEVTKPDGTTVDVRLDDHYGLVMVEGDDETRLHENGN
jgi:hypothetical protein